MLIDSHCHLNYPQFSNLSAVLGRAQEAGVGGFLTIATQVSDFAEVLAIADADRRVRCAIGVHPHEAQSHTDLSEEELLRQADDPRVIGIGETGLDYHYEHSPRAQQQELFRRHIRVGRKLGKPVIVHSRAADEDTLSILREETELGGAFKFLIHCFSTGEALAQGSVALGGYISASGILTFRKSQALRESFARLPLDRLLVETDAPYLAPEPHRGQPCEPAFVAHTAACLAGLHGIEPAQLAEETTRNFHRLFGHSML